MIYSIYPQQDTTIYEVSQSMNTGIDQILELRHDVNSDNSVYNSRILLKFDKSELDTLITDNSIVSASYYLNLTSVDGRNLPSTTLIKVHPLSGSWDMGLGKEQHRPITTNGTSWKYSLSKNSNVIWNTGSLVGNVTSSYKTIPGGGVWYTGSGYESSQSLTFESINLRTDVTSIVDKWLNGIIENDGFIVKRENSDENSLSDKGNLSYFSIESNTVFVPRLEIVWDDSVISTGSLSPITDNIVINPRLNLTYNRNGKYRINVSARKKYPTRTFVTSSRYMDINYLPTSSYYQIEDFSTGEVLIPFDTTGTKLSVDSTGNYFNMWTSMFMPKRFYKITFKVDNGASVEYFDNNYTFKVI